MLRVEADGAGELLAVARDAHPVGLGLGRGGGGEDPKDRDEDGVLDGKDNCPDQSNDSGYEEWHFGGNLPK